MQLRGETILSQTYFFPWVADNIYAVASLNKRMQVRYVDNVRAECHRKLEEMDTLHLADMWSGHEEDKCEGCMMYDCEWCRSWDDLRWRKRGRRRQQEDSEPESEASGESGWSGRPWWA